MRYEIKELFPAAVCGITDREAVGLEGRDGVDVARHAEAGRPTPAVRQKAVGGRLIVIPLQTSPFPNVNHRTSRCGLAVMFVKNTA
jgi:hypothetical protein